MMRVCSWRCIRSGAGVLGRAVYWPCFNADVTGVPSVVPRDFFFSGDTSIDMSTESSGEVETVVELLERRVGDGERSLERCSVVARAVAASKVVSSSGAVGSVNFLLDRWRGRRVLEPSVEEGSVAPLELEVLEERDLVGMVVMMGGNRREMSGCEGR